MHDRIETALAFVAPDREVEEVGSTGPSWNEGNETVRVTFADGGQVYLKVALDDGPRVARERAAVEYVRANCSVPVPTVLDCDPDAAVPHLVTEPVEGTSFLSEWNGESVEGRATLARAVGASLAHVHTLRFDRPGHIVGGAADGLDLDTEPWPDVLVEMVEQQRARSPAERFDHHFDAVIDAIETNRDLLADPPVALLHGDIARPNCFVAENDEVGFLDWEIAHVGDPVQDVNRARSGLDGLRDDGPEVVVDAFFAGYRAVAGSLPAGFDERLPVYRAVRHLGWSGYFENYLQFLDESPEELADWIEDEMERRLAPLS